MKNILYTLFILLLFSQVCFAQSPAIEMSISPREFTLQEQALLTIRVEGKQSVDLPLPQVAGLTFQNRGTSTSINFINGTFSSSSSTRYAVQADQEGSYTIPPLKIEISGKEYHSNPLQFRVLPGQVSNKEQTTDRGDIAFFRIKSPGTHYVGESVPLSIDLFFNEEYQSKIDSPPQLQGEGLLMAPIKDEPEQSQVHLNGKNYTRVHWQTGITGIREGSYPIKFKMGLSVYSQGRQSPFANNFNDPFFNSFFNNSRRIPLEISSDEIVLSLKELPQAGRPENFSGAIGTFRVEVKADTRIADIGQPVTLTSTITGRGNFASVSAPVWPQTAGWKTYPPSPIEGGGNKTFQQVIIPQDISLKKIPSLSFNYFDPDKGSYEQIETAAIPMNIKGTLPVESKKAVAPPRLHSPQRIFTNLLPQYEVSSRLKTNMTPLFLNRWVMALFIGAVLLILLLTARRLFLCVQKKNPQRYKKNIRIQLAQSALAELESALTRDDSSAFLEIAQKAIQQHCALLLNMEPTAITASTLKKNPATRVFIDILQRADRARYGAENLSNQEMNLYLSLLKREFYL